MPHILKQSRNALLGTMREDDRARLAPHLHPTVLGVDQSIERTGHLVTQIYFPEAGAISVSARQSDAGGICIGLIGPEGMTGFGVLLGSDVASSDAAVCIQGSGLQIAAAMMKAALDESPSLRSLCLAYANAFSIQVAAMALATGRQTIEGRLARLLLMLFDRNNDKELPLTHRLASELLGVRRAGVSIAMDNLAAKSLISTSWSRVVLLDRKGLEQGVGAFYGPAEREYKRLCG